MYSEVSDTQVVLQFLDGVLDPKPIGNKGGYAKTDFLLSRAFLDGVQFPGRDALHQLVVDLAYLFSVRYEKPPSKEARADAQHLLDSPDLKIKAMHAKSSVYNYDLCMTQLLGHDATIALFDKALRDRNSWPANDSAKHQYFKDSLKQPMTKMGWRTGLFIPPVQEEVGIGEF